MNEPEVAIISIHPEYAEAILSGKKTIELRRRIPKIEEGTRLWIYATRPQAAIIGSAIVASITRESPASIWMQHSKDAFIPKKDYNNYFRGTDKAIAIRLINAEKCHPVKIDKLREIKEGFHPPQVLIRIS